MSGEEPRVGRVRESMKSNPLLQRVETGKVKQTLFHNDSAGRVFGVPSTSGESARDVMFHWQEHHKDPTQVAEPDYRAMNKLANHSGVTDAKDQRTFREEHLVRQKKGLPPKEAPLLPSDRDQGHVYGKPSSLQSEEQVRISGKGHPSMSAVMQGTFSGDWVKGNQGHSGPAHKQTLNRESTAASRGHDHSQTRSIRPYAEDLDTFKMSKFQHAAPRVDTHQHDAQLVSTIKAMNHTTRDAVHDNMDAVRS